MPYHYIDKSRENDPHALADVEVFESAVWILDCVCGEYEIPSYGEMTDQYADCPYCSDTRRPVRIGGRMGFWYAFGTPGCLWDSAPVGPFDSEDEALAAAREDAGS
jgi:hypothetical protein